MQYRVITDTKDGTDIVGFTNLNVMITFVSEVLTKDSNASITIEQEDNQ